MLATVLPPAQFHRMLEFSEAENQRQGNKYHHDPQIAGTQRNQRAHGVKPGTHARRQRSHQNKMQADNAAVQRQLLFKAPLIAIDKGW